ncbi:hypothetical protein CCE02nite_38340 [Cellulosimicrobium cellulans]|uniref:PIN domain-containing protein n=1 Tax=Cellulosimicrobium cellulans TaxID=1710 RepID=A0A4Y4E7B3_CELCE|nr:hypothetical protein CCE02nite_38340 [Cellulosimicrobium cellulans]
MIVGDANIVIAASNPWDVHHAEVTAIVLEHGPDRIVVHSLTLAEVRVGPAGAGAYVRARHLLEAAGFRLSAEGEPTPEDLALVRAAAPLGRVAKGCWGRAGCPTLEWRLVLRACRRVGDRPSRAA